MTHWFRLAVFGMKMLEKGSYVYKRKDVIDILSTNGITNPDSEIVDRIVDGRIKVEPYDYTKSFKIPNYSNNYPIVSAYNGAKLVKKLDKIGTVAANILGSILEAKMKKK